MALLGSNPADIHDPMHRPLSALSGHLPAFEGSAVRAPRPPLTVVQGIGRVGCYCRVMEPLGTVAPLTATLLSPLVAIVPPVIEKFVLLS